ncbi:MAG: hypothetical protein QNJ32_31140 [Xenococcaceae cyanobacterium MO_167.B27]|nr:hypothetical protein [Xenococcaceae cyanobacterium MO_167.B27]
MTLEKAELHSLDGSSYDFEFLYNPTSISISRKVNVSENDGARTKDKGIPKVSFAHPKATIISIKDIIFDSYEDSGDRNVGNKIQKLTQTVKFIQAKQRPPVYVFAWGNINYLRCYVESLDYQLTLFLPNGTPVRAKASITLKEVDPYQSLTNPPPQSDRTIDSRW